MSLPGIDGVEATRRLKSQMPRVHMIGLTMHDAPEIAQAMLAAGASDSLHKSSPIANVLAAITRVLGDD